jgi:hypothetical protein
MYSDFMFRSNMKSTFPTTPALLVFFSSKKWR